MKHFIIATALSVLASTATGVATAATSPGSSAGSSPAVVQGSQGSEISGELRSVDTKRGVIVVNDSMISFNRRTVVGRFGDFSSSDSIRFIPVGSKVRVVLATSGTTALMAKQIFTD